MWQPNKKQWIVIVVTYLLVAWYWIYAAGPPDDPGPPINLVRLLQVVVGAAVLVVWFLQGKPKK